MKFLKYPKIYRLGMEENSGILEQELCIQEKIDGANLSCWLQDGELHVGSRNNDLTLNSNPFNGAVEYCKNSTAINSYLKDNPTHRLYMEWLVRHTVVYNEEAYRQAYLLDIVVNHTTMERSDDVIEIVPEFMQPEKIQEVIKKYKFKAPEVFGAGKFTLDKINDLCGKTVLGEFGEGVVLKPVKPYINKFGRSVYAKVVTEKFKENNGIIFGGNNKYSESYGETYISNKYMNIARVQKVINKLEQSLDRKVSIKDTARVINTAYHDMIEEETWGMIKKTPIINYKTLNRICTKKAVVLFHSILTGDISVANQ